MKWNEVERDFFYIVFSVFFPQGSVIFLRELGKDYQQIDMQLVVLHGEP